MKIVEILEIASKRTPGEWINTGGNVWQPDVCTGTNGEPEQYQSLLASANDYNGAFIAIAPDMESKLRLLSELLPEIKHAIKVCIVKSTNTLHAENYAKLLKRMEELENE